MAATPTLTVDISDAEREQIYTIVMNELGAPIVKVELTPEMMDSYMSAAVSEYEATVYNWLTVQQWGSIYAFDAESIDLTYYLMTKTLDFERSFTYAYSKQVGLNESGKWELKKDYFVLSAHTHEYIIPANREINAVLWFSRPEIEVGAWASAGGMNVGQTPNGGWMAGGYPASPINHNYNIVAGTQDANLKRRLYGEDFYYKIIGGPNGTKKIVLFPVPGGRYDYNQFGGSWYSLFYGDQGTALSNAVCWYHYYDVNEHDKEACAEENSDVILFPSMVPFSKMRWESINRNTKTWIRNMIKAKAMQALAFVRGKYSGDIQIPDSSVKMDYQMFLSEGKALMDSLKTELTEMLNKMEWVSIMEKRSQIADYTLNIHKKIPMLPFIG